CLLPVVEGVRLSLARGGGAPPGGAGGGVGGPPVGRRGGGGGGRGPGVRVSAAPLGGGCGGRGVGCGCGRRLRGGRRAARRAPIVVDRARIEGPMHHDASAEVVLGAIEQRVASLGPARMPLLDPDPAVPAQVGGAAPPEHFASAITRAVERIKAGEIEKVVLA